MNTKNNFYRLSKSNIGNGLYTTCKNLQSFYENVKAGNDVDMESLDRIIEALTKLKEKVKLFDFWDEVKSTVYENNSIVKRFDEFLNENRTPKELERLRRQTSILPCGTVDLKSGKNSEYNIYDNYAEQTTLEVWKKCESSKYVIISTSGTNPIGKLNQMTSFKHDQNMRFLFDAEMVDSILAVNGKDLIFKYGQKLQMYVYK